jgi:tetratricopeptide (TPR) repeat protein
VTRVVVLPFSVRGSSEFDYLSQGMVDLLSRKLDVAGELRGVDPRAVLAMVSREGGGAPDPERGRTIAGRFGAEYFVLGAILVVGTRLQVDASLYDARGELEAIAEAGADGRAEELFGLVDEVAAQLLLSTGGVRGAPVARIAAVTTDSLSALKDYLHGERALRRGEYLAAADAFRRAVAVDSSFALAWYRLSVAYEWLTRDHLVREAAERAFRHSGRLSERDRLLLQAAVAARQGKDREAEERYRAIVGEYSDDVEAWFQLGELQFHYGPMRGRSISTSRQAFERVLSYEPNDVNALVHLARIAAIEGKLGELDSLVNRFLRLNPAADRAIELRALRAIASDEEAELARVVADLRQASDPSLLVTVTYDPVMAADPRAGVTLAAVLTEEPRTPEMRALGHVLRAYFLAALGRFADADGELDAAERLDRPRAAEFRGLLRLLPFGPARDAEVEAARAGLERIDPQAVPLSVHPSGFVRAHNEVHQHLKTYLLGLLYARLGDYRTPERHASQLARLPSPERNPSFAQDLSLVVRAYTAWRRSQAAPALALLERTRLQIYYQSATISPFYSQSFQRYLRALLLEEAGRLDEALRWYSSFEEGPAYDFVFAAPAHLRRAEIHERRGELEAAAKHYARFVELWSDCDPALRPMVQQAEQRLAELTAGGGG